MVVCFWFGAVFQYLIKTSVRKKKDEKKMQYSKGKKIQKERKKFQ